MILLLPIPASLFASDRVHLVGAPCRHFDVASSSSIPAGERLARETGAFEKEKRKRLVVGRSRTGLALRSFRPPSRTFILAFPLGHQHCHLKASRGDHSLLNQRRRCHLQQQQLKSACLLSSPPRDRPRAEPSPLYRTRDIHYYTPHNERHSHQHQIMRYPRPPKACSAPHRPSAARRIPTSNAQVCRRTPSSNLCRSRPPGWWSAWVDSAAYCNQASLSLCPSSTG